MPLFNLPVLWWLIGLSVLGGRWLVIISLVELPLPQR